MSDTVLSIDKLENGYTVRVCDEEIMKKNHDPKNKVWQDPWKEYAFSTAAEVTSFVTSKLESLKPPPDAATQYAGAFDKAAKED